MDYKSIELFNNPAELCAVVDPQVRGGTVKIHPWQLRLHHDFAKPSTADAPYRAVLRAANGSGKDKMGIAPCATWLALKYTQSNSIVTSSSGRQLDTQTDTYVNQLCQGINSYFGDEIFKCNYREYRNNITGGVIDLFATDEPGKAEGAHPIIHDGQMGIFVSEAKSVPDAIFDALVRCNGFTKRLDVSSPGAALGHFYDICSRSEELGWIQYHITAFDCPHLAKSYIEYVRNKYGETHLFYRSMVLAEFGAQDGELLVLTADKLFRLMKVAPVMMHLPGKFNVGGLDLAAGGDETVLAVRNGNKVIAIEGFRMADTAKSIRHLEGLFRTYELTSENSPVFADAGGLGKPIIDQLRDRGWNNVQYTMNQWEPRDKIAYANLGTENWFKLSRLIEEMEIILPFGPRDDALEKQLVERYYKIPTTSNKFILESKIQARAKGHPSPDRADAVVLCFSNYQPTYLQREHRKVQAVPVTVERPKPDPTLRQLALGNTSQRVLDGFVRQPTVVEMHRLLAETNFINNRLKNYFTVKKLLEERQNEREEISA